jgi:hypothetical protein
MNRPTSVGVPIDTEGSPMLPKIPKDFLTGGTFAAPKRTFKSGLAFAFVREAAVWGAGHVAWGFRLPDGYYYYGGTENPEGPGGMWASWHQGTAAQGGNNAAWVDYGTEKQMLKKMKDPRPFAPYNYAKAVAVAKPKADAALKIAKANINAGFTGLTNNCLDATYRVLQAYGADMPWPSTNWAPNGWFNAIKHKTFIRL